MYIIPRNISKRFEFFPGWGWRELLVTAVGVGIGLAFSFLIGLATPGPAVCTGNYFRSHWVHS